jgi:rhamnosyltransferase
LQNIDTRISAEDCAVGATVPPERRNTCAIIVTYHPDAAFPDRFSHLLQQVDAIFVVDNNSGPDAVSMLQSSRCGANSRLILNGDNLGLAAALNIGVKQSMAADYNWALLFDQDTTPGPGLLKGFREAFEEFPERQKLAIIGANYIEPSIGKPRFPAALARGRRWINRRVVITSGSLLSLQAYKRLGPFREDYFIDCIDHEFCLRARSKGFKIIATRAATMVHGIGLPTLHRLPWRRIDVTNHSSVRRYYMIRNHVDLAKAYILREPVWVFASLWTRVKSMLILCIFEKDRVAKIKLALLGLRDGLLSNFNRKLT